MWPANPVSKTLWRRVQEIIPNILTASRFILAFVVLILLQQQNLVAALVVFILAAFTDFPDGYLARKWSVVSSFGERYDPFVDKFLLLLPLGFFTAFYHLTWLFFGLVLLREIIITVLREYRYTTGKSLPADRHGKIKVNLQYSLVAIFFVNSLSLLIIPTWLILFWYCFVSLYTVWSGLLYIQKILSFKKKLR